MPTCSSSFVHITTRMEAFIGSPVPTVFNVVNFAHRTPVANKPVAIRTPIRNFSVHGRLRVRMNLIGIRASVRSIVINMAKRY